MFKRKANQIIREIRSRGRLPIVVGGTHYYTQSLLFEDSLVSNNIDGEEGVETELSHQEISEKFPILDGPPEAILERLREVDSVMADRWHPNDTRRIRRSLEIFLLSGKKASDIYAEQKETKSSKSTQFDVQEGPCQPVSDTLLFWVHSDSNVLKRRLDNRVDKMLHTGLLDEVKSMNNFLNNQIKGGIAVDRTRGIWISIGWKEFEHYLAALENGSEPQEKLEELYELSIEQTKAATRQYARRQTRWIRLKLMPALSDQKVLDKLFLLDGSDITLWEENVSKPAMETAESFLAGSELCPPSDLSQAAKQILGPEKALDTESILIHQECDICNVVCVREAQWQAHLRSRRHRQVLKKRQRNPNGMSSLPKNDNTSGSPETP
jgi:tRNA dimethylallyltransferase